MSEYWLISAPGEKTIHQTWEALNNATSKQDLAKNSKFPIPDLKVGTLDTLVGLSDDLAKLDTYVESVCRKLATCIHDTLENKNDNINEHLMANGHPLSKYLTQFQWEKAKYPSQQSLKVLYDIINKQLSQIDADLKTKSSVYNSLKGTLQSMERKQTGSLLVRNLGDICQRKHFVLGSEYLTTLLVVVPKAYFKEWNLKYEKLVELAVVPRSSELVHKDNEHGLLAVVPRSSELVHEDNEHGLFTVTLFSKSIEDFKSRCRENKFVVRDFQYNEQEIADSKNMLVKLEQDKEKKLQNLLRWLKINFSETFIAWVHVKALRVFVESVLRYGLPVNFLAVLIHPNKKQQRKLRETLNSLYSHLDSSATGGPMEDIPGLNMGPQEYYPYVYFKINIDMLSNP